MNIEKAVNTNTNLVNFGNQNQKKSVYQKHTTKGKEEDTFISRHKKAIIAGGILSTVFVTGLMSKKGLLGDKLKNIVDDIFSKKSTETVKAKPQTEKKAEIETQKPEKKENVNVKGNKFPAISEEERIRLGDRADIERLEKIRSNARELEAQRWEQLAKIEPQNAQKWLKNADKVRQNNFDTNYYFNQQMGTGLLPRVYSSIRSADYTNITRHNSQIDKITSKSTPLIQVLEQKGWHYRQPKNYQGGTITERISINAIADEGLIKALDELFTKEGINGYYKTPSISEWWLERHDPVTIYLNDKATPEVLKKVQNAAQGYIRSTDDVLVGDKFAPGFALEKSPTAESIEEVLSRAKEFDPEFEKAARAFLTNRSNKLSASSGQITAIERVMKELTG